MIDRLICLFVAVNLALLVWLYARSRDQEILDHVPIPVHVTLPAKQGGQYTLEIAVPAQVLATFTGPPARIRELRALLQREELRVELPFAVPADRLKEPRLTEAITVEASDVHAPPGVTTTLVPGRNQVHLVLNRLMERRLPVCFDRSLETHLGPVVIEPETVLVRGPQEVVEHLSAVATQPWILPHKAKSRDVSAPSARVPLVHDIETRPICCEPSFVRVRTSTQPYRTYTLSDVSVHFLCPDAYPLRPRFSNDRAGRIALRVSGPVREEPPPVHAFVDLTKLPARPGLYDEDVQLQLPKDFEPLDGPTPRKVVFELVPAEAPARGLGAVPSMGNE
jgi:hypothetical protein